MKQKRKCIWIMLIIINSIHIPDLQAELLIVHNQKSHIGDQVTIDVSISNAANTVGAMGFDICFDPDILEYIDFVPGPFLEKYAFFDISIVDDGCIRMGAIERFDPIQPHQSGILFHLIFQNIDYGHSDIEILHLKDDIHSWKVQAGEFQSNDFHKPEKNTICYKFDQLWPALKQPWYFYHPMDIAVDLQGFVYIADTWNDRIQKYSSSGHFVTKWGVNGNAEGHFQTPTSIATYQSRNDTYVFVVDQHNHRIQKFTGDGKFVDTWGSYGSEKGQFQSPSGIAIDLNGFVYVADTGNSRIQKFTQNGQWYQEWRSDSNTNNKMLSPHSLAIDRSQRVYVTDVESQSVITFSSNGKMLYYWDHWQTDRDEFFFQPSGIEVIQLETHEMLLVSDSANDRIVSFMLDGNPLADHETIIEKLPSKLNYPAGIASGKKGQIHIADATNNRIVSIQIEPEIAVSQWSSQGTQKGSFIRPNGICVIDDHVLVSNGTSTIPQNYHWVQRFSKQGVYLDRWPQYTISDNILASSNSLHRNQLSTVADSTAMLYRPSAIAQDDHFYYILDSGNHRLIQMNHDHTISKIWGQKGTMPGEMDTPRGLALFHDLVVIADTGNDRIVVFDNAGNYQLDFGEYGADEGQFLMPKDIDIDMDGIIYVADTGNNRIQRFSIDGHFLGQWGEWGNQNGQMNTPSGIAVHPDNTKIVVADTGNHRCQVFDKQGSYITKFGEHGSGAGQFNEPYHLDIDLDHNIYVTDRINNRVQKFQPITLNDDIVKGIIVVGDDTYGDALFQTNANLAYRALNYQGMGKNDIFYMSKDTDLDLDDNGLADDIDSLATNNNLQNAVTDWADDAQHVIIFLIGHNDLFFRMNASEILDNAHLDEWMDQLQTKSNCRITFIFDACKSGNYIQTYSAPEGYSRVIITSTGIDENAYLMGAISFSNYFWTHIFNGNTVQTAFIQAAQTTGQINQPPFMAMPQNPLMDANNNGIANETQDYSLTQQLYLGNAGNDQPETLKILSIASPITLTQGTSSVLWAQVESDTNEIQRVWSIIRPPDYQAGVSDTIETELIHIDNNHYQSVFQNFEISGTYLIAYYAMDDSGKVSMPEFSTVSVNTPMARRAVIIVGETFDLTLDAYLETVAASIYDALIFQGYTDETLYVMSPRIITNGWDGMVNANNIQYALNQWTQTDDGANATQDIVICFLGKTLDNAFIVNYGESISSDHFNTQLTYLENQMPGKIVVICDMPNGLGFLSQSAQSGSERRVHISGSSENERAVFIVENNISFSTFFWQRVLNGFDIKSAFTATTDALNILNHYQSPCLEANGDGNVNEYEDYVNAREFTIGYGIMQAQDTVSIASVMPQKELSGESQSIIWVKQVTSTSTIDAVWAVIVPPGIYETDNMIIDNLPQTELKYNESTNRYEGRYDTFNVFGTYRIAIYARSANGMTSVPVETRLHQTGCPDSYELNQDNTIEQAAVINVNASDAQYHNFHNNQDIDWVKFYALEGTMYRIFTTNADLNCDTILSLYDQNQKMIIQKNSGIGDENEVIHWSCPGDGIYYVSVQNYKTDATDGLNTGYELRINLTATIFDGHINGYVRIQGTETPIANALIRTSKNLSDISLPFGTYRISGHESGEAMIFAQATGFLPYASTINVLSLSMTRHDIYMTPKIPSGDLNLDGFIRLDDAIIAGKILTNIDLSDQTWFVSDRLGVADMVYILNACAGFY